jgi:hypothetical protein
MGCRCRVDEADAMASHKDFELRGVISAIDTSCDRRLRAGRPPVCRLKTLAPSPSISVRLVQGADCTLSQERFGLLSKVIQLLEASCSLGEHPRQGGQRRLIDALLVSIFAILQSVVDTRSLLCPSLSVTSSLSLVGAH